MTHPVDPLPIEGQPMNETPPRALAIQPPTPMALLSIAVNQGADIEKLEKLMALQERWEANEARKAFTAAMSAFKAMPLAVYKRQTVDFSSAKGRTHYKHATLSDVTSVVAPAMSEHSLSYRWEVQQEARQVTVTCVVTHALGHSERVSMQGPLDDSGNKNAIQQAGSTVTYLQRYTLLAVTGLSTQDESDDDGNGAGYDDHPQTETAPRPPAPPEFYPHSAFATNLPAWRELIESGKKTPDEVIKVASRKAPLNDAQKAKLREFKAKPAGEPGFGDITDAQGRPV